MSLDVNGIEAFWIVLNGITFVVSLLAFREARRDQRLVSLKNGRTREIATAGHVRREGVRAIIQVLLLALVVPGLFSDRPVTLSLGVVVLIAIAIAVFVNTMGDFRDMRRITAELYRGMDR